MTDQNKSQPHLRGSQSNKPGQQSQQPGQGGQQGDHKPAQNLSEAGSKRNEPLEFKGCPALVVGHPL
jgi:hypothetical protein